jgi:hypothetical protein
MTQLSIHQSSEAGLFGAGTIGRLRSLYEGIFPPLLRRRTSEIFCGYRLRLVYPIARCAAVKPVKMAAFTGTARAIEGV